EELNVTHCWICGGTLLTEMWPRRGSSLSPLEFLRWRKNQNNPKIRIKTGIWILSAPVMGEECLQQEGRMFKDDIGNTGCQRYLVTNRTDTWWVPNASKIHRAKHRKSNKCV
ncbi:ENR1 protein, partial [Edolisoma coerulescens]|nr:ENR1 protein [Edolisoma coerulescens]